MSITSDLAEIIVATRYDDIPAEAVETARQVVLDGIGVIIAGAREPQGLGRITIDYVRKLGGTPESTVFPAGFKTNAPNAAYVGGTLGHALDFDNTWWPLNHPTSPTLPAILALAERDGLSGRDALSAIVLSFEVQGRMRAASEKIAAGGGFHKPGVSGTMGAVTAAGKLLGLNAGQLCMAYGIAGSRAGSLPANTGSMTKSTHSGHAARMGVECAILAGMSFTGHADIFDEGEFFRKFYGEGYYDLDLFLKDFGQPYRIVHPGVGFKKHPSNYFTHRPIDAALELRRRHVLDPGAIDRVEVDFPPFAYVNRPQPKTGLDGKFSIQYATAVALLDGRIAIETFSDARRFAPDAVSLLARTTLVLRNDIPMDFNDTWANVRVFLKDGRVLEERCDKPRGLWGVPLTRDERLAKFRMCVEPAYPAVAVEEIIAIVENLAEERDISRLMGLLGRARVDATREARA